MTLHWQDRIRERAASRTRGESMVFVVVVMLLFFTLGIAVMTAAATTSGSATARLDDRQAYYYGRSMLDTIDDTLRTGGLGNALCNAAKDELLAAYNGSGGSVANVAIDHTAPIPLSVGLSADACFQNTAVQNAQLTYTGYADVLNTDGAAVSEVSVRLQNVELRFDLTYKSRYVTSMRVIYRYSGWGAAPGTTGTDWRWSGTWYVQQVS